MELTMKRHIASWVLLAIFLPMLLVSSIHTHETQQHKEKIECLDCDQHVCHVHTLFADTSFDECLLCQFLLLTFMSAAIVAVVYYSTQCKILFAQCRQAIYLVSCGVIRLRAPPVPMV